MSNPKPGPSGRRRTRKRGQALVEFALVIPIFMLVLAGILDFGFALFSRMTVINAAREGARAAVMVPDHYDQVASRAATSAAKQGGLTPSSVTTICLQTSVSPTSPPTILCTSAKAGDSVSVTVNYPYTGFFPGLFARTFNLSATVQMVIDT